MRPVITANHGATGSFQERGNGHPSGHPLARGRCILGQDAIELEPGTDIADRHAFAAARNDTGRAIAAAAKSRVGISARCTSPSIHSRLVQLRPIVKYNLRPLELAGLRRVSGSPRGASVDSMDHTAATSGGQ